MPLNPAEYIDGLSANDPTKVDPVAECASHLRAIKRSLQQTFPNWDEGLDIGPTQLDGFETRIAALEAAPTFAQSRIASGGFKTAGSGNYVITDLGFTPTLIWVVAGTDELNSAAVEAMNMSLGIADGTVTHVVSYLRSNASTFDHGYSENLLWTIYGHAGVLGSTGVLASLDADGFTLTHTLVDITDVNILWAAFE